MLVDTHSVTSPTRTGFHKYTIQVQFVVRPPGRVSEHDLLSYIEGERIQTGCKGGDLIVRNC